MFDAAEAARDAGVNLAFFGGNAVYTQVRFEPSAAGVPNRVVVEYRNVPWNPIDPVQGPTTTTEFRHPPVNRPEQTLLGIQYGATLPNTDYVVINSSHWVYAGTGFQDGDAVPGIVGYEADSYMPNYPPPNSANHTLLSQSPYTNPEGETSYLNSSIYQAPSGAWVFASGTMSWSWALDDVPGSLRHFRVDSRIQQATANILNAFLTGTPIVKVLVGEAPATVTAGQAFTIVVTAENDQGNPVAQYGGTVHFSSSDTSAGAVLPADATLTNGQGTFSATLIKVGPQTVTVVDAANSLSTTVTVIVRAASATRLALAATAAPTAGQAFSFSVTAQDPFGNTDPAYAGRVHFTSSDTSAGVVLPADATLTNGQGTFSATLVRAGSPTITGTDTVTASLAGSMTVTVRAASATSISLGVPAAVIKGTAFTVNVTLKDQFGNVATGYTGTVHFEASAPVSSLEVLPPDYTFTSNDAGSRAFSVTLWAPSRQTISVTDTANSSLTDTSPTITIVVRLPGL
jgi:N,N-dimethylformamidase beta subunit-like protein